MAIEFSGEYRIRAAKLRVWEALNDPAVLQACIAGCRQLDKVSDREFNAIVAAKVGPVTATFRGNVLLSDIDPPNGYTLTGQGQAGAAGFARMSARVLLTEDQSDTLLKYTASADIGGKLASVGSRLVQMVAKKNADDFFSAFARHLGGTGVKEEATPSPASAAALGPVTVLAKERAASGGFGALAATVPAWVVVFTACLAFALGYCVGR